MDLEKIQSKLDTLQKDVSLFKETNLNARAEALDFIAFVDEIVRLRGRRQDLTALHEQAASLQRRLEDVNGRFFQKLRVEIRARHYTPGGLRRLFDQFTDYNAGEKAQTHMGYDGLDVLIGGLLLADPAPGETQERSPEMVHWEMAPARAILDLVDNVDFAQKDVFYDLGAGLGQIVILVNLLAGIEARGVEFEPAFCEYAQARARELGLSKVRFITADARDADYADGTVFFMFTPFKGEILQMVLERLRFEGQKRPIKICTYGSCTPVVARQNWLRIADQRANHEFKLAVFDNI